MLKTKCLIIIKKMYLQIIIKKKCLLNVRSKKTDLPNKFPILPPPKNNNNKKK